MSQTTIAPQPGFQTDFLTSNADITIGGGAAGVGKTFAGLLAPLYHKDVKGYGAVYFRRTYAQIKKQGAIWDQSMKVYPALGSTPSEMKHKFPNSVISFSHLQHEKNLYDHMGSEYPTIIFDELTHFSESMFFYLMSRNRTTCKVKPQVYGTCNPDPDSFVARLIEWWIDQESGFPIKERAGVKRYFARINEALLFGDTKQEVLDKSGNEIESIVRANPEISPFDLIKSITFIPGSIYDNKKLLETNPEYLANLLAQDEKEKLRLLEGNWKVRQDDSSLFDFEAIGDLFSNHVTGSERRYITCDAARYGRDLCVIMVWKDWEVIHIEVLKKSDIHDITDTIEKLRRKLRVPKSKTLVDADGVGAGTVSRNSYKGFHGGAQPRKIKGVTENYKNLKTQCFYQFAEKRVNMREVRINVDNESCMVDGVRSSKVKLGAKVSDIRELIRDDLRAIKRITEDIERKKQVNSKDDQKVILGRSPDFADTLMMREWFELYPTDIYL